MKKDSFTDWLDGMQYVRTGDKFYGPGHITLTQEEVRRQYDNYLNYVLSPKDPEQ